MAIALSTCFVHAHALAPEAVADLYARGSAAGALLDAGLSPALFEALVPLLLRAGIPVLAVEAPCPRTRASAARLCAADREEGQVALDAALETVRVASTFGARFVVITLGEIAELARAFAYARNRFVRGDLDEQHALELLDARDDVAGRSLDAARRALDRLSRAAEPTGLTLVLRSPRRYTALPSPQELDLLLDELAGAPLAPALDVPAAHLQDVMGFHPLALTLATYASRSPLIYGGDACGALGALPPGRGILDLAAIEAKLPAEAARVIAPWSGLTLTEVATLSR